MLENVITATKSAKILGVTWRDLLLLKDVLRIAVAAIVAGIVSWFVLQVLAGSGQLVKFTFSVLSFALVYLTAILLLRIITPEEWHLLKAQMKRPSMPWN